MHGPLVITGTGGSGTRVVARIAMKAGWHLGYDRNDQEDNMRVAACENHPIGTRFLDDGGPTGQQKSHYRATILRERYPHKRWGWKHSQSMYFLPWLVEFFPDTLRVLHVVRDGRDMAYSANVFEHWFGPYYLSETEREIAPEPVRNAKLWARSNIRVAEIADRHIPDRYMVVRLEDLCADPVAWIEVIFGFLDGRAPPYTNYWDDERSFWRHENKRQDTASLVETPDSLGRWRCKPEDEQCSVEQAALPGLQRFGYA